MRTAFNFSGEEKMGFAGGEELWVFIHGQLVTQVFHNPMNSSVPCRTIHLFAASKGKHQKTVLNTILGLDL